MAKFIYFDIGGVLMDYKFALRELALEHNVTLADFDRVYDQHGHHAERGDITLQDLWGKYVEELSLKKDDSFDFLEYWTEHLLPIEENHQTLMDISQSHRVGILSNMYEGAIPKLLEKKKIPNAPYSIIIESCEVRHIKPEEKIYTLAAKMAGVSPKDIIYIDDRRDFIAFTKNLGWNGIWYEKDNGVNLKTALADLL